MPYLKLVITPQSSTWPVHSLIYMTLLQKRNSFGRLSAQSKLTPEEQTISVHHVVGTSLWYSPRHIICLKYFHSEERDSDHIHESRRPPVWHRLNWRSSVSIPSEILSGENIPVKAKYSCHCKVRRCNTYTPDIIQGSSAHLTSTTSLTKGLVLSQQISLTPARLVRLVSLIW